MLQGKTVFISGGAGYLGTDICKLCAHYGAKVIFSYHKSKEKALELEKEIPGSTAVEINLRDVNDIKTKIEQITQSAGLIDVLINNASISQIMPLAMLEEEDVDLVLDINIKGPLFLTKAVIRGMIKNKYGRIVNIGSIAGHRLLDVPITYATTKAAVSGFTFSLASELKRFGIRVNSVIPGVLDGGVSNGIPADLKADFINHCSLGRAGSAKEVAEAVCFLASEKASYINGQCLFVDGGL